MLYSLSLILKIYLQYKQYLVYANGEQGRKIKFRFCDTMGIDGLNCSDFATIMDGHVMNNTEVNM